MHLQGDFESGIACNSDLAGLPDSAELLRSPDIHVFFLAVSSNQCIDSILATSSLTLGRCVIPSTRVNYVSGHDRELVQSDCNS